MTLMEHKHAPKYPNKKSFFQRVVKEARQNGRPWLVHLGGKEETFASAGVDVCATHLIGRSEWKHGDKPAGLVWLGAMGCTNDYAGLLEDLKINAAADTVVFLEHCPEDELPEGVNYIARFGHAVAFLIYPEAAANHKHFTREDNAVSEDDE